MKINKNIVIAALARDCQESLPNMILLVEQLRKRFTWSQVVVVENDSKDNTKELLFDWEKRKNGVKIISKDYGSLTIPLNLINGVKPLVSFHRIDKMVKYRNIYLKYIKEIKHDIDYVIVIDVDIESFSIESVVNSILEFEPKCGGVFANGVTVKRIFGVFYSKIFYDVFAVYEYPTKRTFSYTEDSLSETLKSVTEKLKRDKFYQVISAFGGIGIYNYKAISGIEYTTVSNGANKSEAICEHIPFNTQILKLGYKNYISCDMEVIYGEHSFGSILKFYLPKQVFDILFKIFRRIKKSK